MHESDFEREQYAALRSEILRSMEDGNQIMAFGLAGIGLIVNAGFAARASFAGFFVFSALLPVLSSFVLSMWFAAQERTARASYFLSGIEARLKDAGKLNAVSWEAWLRSGGPSGGSNHFWSTELSAIALFATLVVGSWGLSLATPSDEVSRPVGLAILCISASVVGLVFADMRRRFVRWKTWLSTTFMTDDQS